MGCICLGWVYVHSFNISNLCSVAGLHRFDEQGGHLPWVYVHSAICETYLVYVHSAICETYLV